MDDMRDGETVFEEDLELGVFWRWALRAVFLFSLIALLSGVAHDLARPKPTGEIITETHWVALAFSVIPLLALVVLFWRIRIRSQVDGAGVAIRFCVFPPRRISFFEIADVSVDGDSCFHIGYGWDPIFMKCIDYGVGARYRLTLHCRNGWRVRVSTNKPNAFQVALSDGRRRG